MGVATDTRLVLAGAGGLLEVAHEHAQRFLGLSASETQRKDGQWVFFDSP